jgi:hypothetical protein
MHRLFKWLSNRVFLGMYVKENLYMGFPKRKHHCGAFLEN